MSKKLSQADLDRLENLLDRLQELSFRASLAPWEIVGAKENFIFAVKDKTGEYLAKEASNYPVMFSRQDTELLIALRNAAPELIDLARQALKESVEEVEEEKEQG